MQAAPSPHATQVSSQGNCQQGFTCTLVWVWIHPFWLCYSSSLQAWRERYCPLTPRTPLAQVAKCHSLQGCPCHSTERRKACDTEMKAVIPLNPKLALQLAFQTTSCLCTCSERLSQCFSRDEKMTSSLDHGVKAHFILWASLRANTGELKCRMHKSGSWPATLQLHYKINIGSSLNYCKSSNFSPWQFILGNSLPSLDLTFSALISYLHKTKLDFFSRYQHIQNAFP